MNLTSPTPWTVYADGVNIYIESKDGMRVADLTPGEPEDYNEQLENAHLIVEKVNN